MGRIAAALCLLLCGMSAGTCASLRVTPASLDISWPVAASTLTLRNDSERPLHVQVRIFRWKLSAGQMALEPTADVVVSPPAAALLPNQDYTVRVVRTNRSPVSSEESYRILVDELPGPATAKSSGVRFALRYSIPVFFSQPNAAATNVEWSAQVRGNMITLAAANNGGRRQRITNFRLLNGDNVIVRRDGLFGYVLSGSIASWAFSNISTDQRGGPLKIMAETENGPITAMVRSASGTK
jgi:fimbrial chaperone protein